MVIRDNSLLYRTSHSTFTNLSFPGPTLPAQRIERSIIQIRWNQSTPSIQTITISRAATNAVGIRTAEHLQIINLSMGFLQNPYALVEDF